MNRSAALAGRRGLAVGALVTMLALAGCGGTDGSTETPVRDDPSTTSTLPTEPYPQGTDASPDGAAVPRDAEVGPAPYAATTPEPGIETDADRLAGRNLGQMQRENFERSIATNQRGAP